MSLPEVILSAYFFCGILFTMIMLILRRKEGGFMSFYPWAAEPAFFIIAMVFWPATVLVLLLTKSKADS